MMFISDLMKIGQLDLNLNLNTYVRMHTHTRARTHVQHGPQCQKIIFFFQKESRLETLNFGVFTAVITKKDTAFWYVLPCSLVEIYRRVRGKSLNFHKATQSQDSL